jgi:hypothetical protein
MMTTKKHYFDNIQRCETDERHKMIEQGLNKTGTPQEQVREWAYGVDRTLGGIEQRLNGTRADDLQIGGDHYKEMGVQPWAVMEAVLTREEFIGFLKGNIIKYSMRNGKKGEFDAGKCHHYMQKLKEVLAK